MDKKNTTNASFAMQSQDLFRLFNAITVVAILLYNSSLSLNDGYTSGLSIALLVYILISNISLRFTPSSYRQRSNFFLNLTDSALIGAFLAYINFSPLLTIIFFTLSVFHALIHGGWVKTGKDVLSLTSGAVIFATLSPANLILTQDDNSALIAMTMLTLYLSFAGASTFRNGIALQQQLSTLKKHMIQIKLRSYKLSKYLSPVLRKEILSGKEVKLETNRKKLTLFFSDIVGFSELAEEMDTEALTALLNNYLTEMSDIAIKFGATIDKFIGDGIMIFYGDPVSRGPKNDCVACVSMAIAMKKQMKALQLRWANQGIQKPLEIRMGINTGYCTVGNFGTEDRLDYTVLGTEVNLASRLEAAADKGDILISHETYSLVKDIILCEDKGEIHVKGYLQAIRIYSVLDMRKNLGKDQAYFEHSTDGFSVHLDVEKINNYDRKRIINSLKNAAQRLEEEPQAQSIANQASLTQH